MQFTIPRQLATSRNRSSSHAGDTIPPWKTLFVIGAGALEQDYSVSPFEGTQQAALQLTGMKFTHDGEARLRAVLDYFLERHGSPKIILYGLSWADTCAPEPRVVMTGSTVSSSTIISMTCEPPRFN